MFDRLQDVVSRWEDLDSRLQDPGTLASHALWSALQKEKAQLDPLVQAWRAWKRCQEDLAAARDLLEDSDPGMREMGRAELQAQQEALPALEQALRVLLLPQDPMDGRNIVLEVRAGTGGDESALFAGDLLAMYTRLAQHRGWRVEVLSESPGTMGGFKEVIALITGDRVYSTLKFESGVHRVQRVPATESQGRIHTSACTVAILPEAEEVDVAIQPQDLRIDTYRASGAGGQHVNRTDSAIRITHLPTGLVVTCQDEKSQHKNRDRAMKVLRSRLLEQERERADAERADARKGQVGSGDRSERIRTYNFPQNRVTDHRIGLTLHTLDRFMMGEMDEVLQGLQTAHQAELLAGEEGI
jgi:peptide chain release factor 1